MKGLLLFGLMLIGAGVSAQLEIYDSTNQTLVTNQTVIVTGNPGETGAINSSADIHADLVLINNTGSSREFKVERVEVIPHVGTKNYICWVICEPNPFTTGDYQSRTSQLSYTVDDGDTSTLLNAHYMIEGEDGCSLFKYKIFDVNDPQTFAEVYVRFEHTSTGCATLNIDELGNSNQVKIYPNPATTNVKIEIENNHSISSLQIVDMLGKTVKTINTSNTSGVKNVDVSNLNKGFYFVKVMNGTKVMESKKLMIN